MSMAIVMVMVIIQWHTEPDITHGPDGIRMSFTSHEELEEAIFRIPLSWGPQLHGCVPPLHGVL